MNDDLKIIIKKNIYEISKYENIFVEFIIKNCFKENIYGDILPLIFNINGFVPKNWGHSEIEYEPENFLIKLKIKISDIAKLYMSLNGASINKVYNDELAKSIYGVKETNAPQRGGIIKIGVNNHLFKSRKFYKYLLETKYEGQSLLEYLIELYELGLHYENVDLRIPFRSDNPEEFIRNLFNLELFFGLDNKYYFKFRDYYYLEIIKIIRHVNKFYFDFSGVCGQKKKILLEKDIKIINKPFILNEFGGKKMEYIPPLEKITNSIFH